MQAHHPHETVELHSTAELESYYADTGAIDVTLHTLIISSNEIMRFDASHLLKLAIILNELHVHTLQLNQVDLLQSSVLVRGTFESLRHVSLTSCHGHILPFINFIVDNSPQLRTLHETRDGEIGPRSLGSFKSNYERCEELLKVCRSILAAVDSNYSLYELTSEYLKDEIRLIMGSGIRSLYLKQLGDFGKTLDLLLKRNDNGYMRCQEVILQLFLIKRFTKAPSVFDWLNLDVVRLIAKMLHETQGNVAWCS